MALLVAFSICMLALQANAAPNYHASLTAILNWQEKLSQITKDPNAVPLINVDELGDLLQGDLDETEESLLKNSEPSKKWTSATIPYTIDTSAFTSSQLSTIQSAIDEYTKYTCIKWVKRSTQSNYVYITRKSGCSSRVGMVGGRQDLSLGTGCVYKGIVMHEMMHASGFHHEHTRYDRDSYVRIVWSNIQEGKEHNFNKNPGSDTLGTKYDYGSIMHYGKTSFAKDKSKASIEVLTLGATIGQRTAFSSTDKTKLNLLYNCAFLTLPIG